MWALRVEGFGSGHGGIPASAKRTAGRFDEVVLGSVGWTVRPPLNSFTRRATDG